MANRFARTSEYRCYSMPCVLAQHVLMERQSRAQKDPRRLQDENHCLMTNRILLIGPEVPLNFPDVSACPDVAAGSITKPESQISRFISLAPPHEVIAYLLHVLGFTIDEIASRQNTTLHALLEEIATAL